MSKEEIIRLEEKVKEADASREIDTAYILEDLLAPAVRFVGPKGEICDKSFIVKAHGPQRVPFDQVTVEESDIEVFSENMAQVHSVYTYVMKGKSFKLRFFRVWQRLNGKWQITGGSTTTVTP